jgi:hypothetical protein
MVCARVVRDVTFDVCQSLKAHHFTFDATWISLAHTNRQLHGETIPLFEEANRRLQRRRKNVKFLEEWDNRQTKHFDTYCKGDMRSLDELFARMDEDARNCGEMEAAENNSGSEMY